MVYFKPCKDEDDFEVIIGVRMTIQTESNEPIAVRFLLQHNMKVYLFPFFSQYFRNINILESLAYRRLVS